MLKRRKKTIFLGLTVLLISVSVGYFLSVVNKPLKGKDNIELNVETGESFYSILDKLKQSDNLKSKTFVKLYIKGTTKDIEIIPGNYIISQESSLIDLIDLLNQGPNQNITNVTIPEGYTIDDISDVLQKNGICEKKDFILAINKYPLPSYIKEDNSKKYDLEGFLFPDTYKFEKNEDPNYVIKTMLDHFESQFEKLINDINIKVNEEQIDNIITVASMIEKEARLDNERKTIASVIYNRLSIDMMLQIDATVIYALGEHVEIVTHKNLEIESPYNTYRNYGLPVGPISNPGIKSIEAALKPESTNYLFYVLQNDGTHYFTDNIDDFYNKQDELGY